MDELLREAISLLPLVGVAAGVLAVVLVAAAFVMAESGEMLDSWFGRAVFYAAPAASGIWVLVSELTPDVLGALKLERLDAALLLFAAVGAAGACGALVDLAVWLFRGRGSA